MKNKRKVKVFFTMDPDLYKEFELILSANLIGKSKLIEHLIKEFIEKSKNPQI